MDADDIIRELKEMDTRQLKLLQEACAEIERLRASQFRWIPVGERMLPEGDEWVLTVLQGDVGQTRACHLSRANYTHWAPIPPLPEKSQEEKDEELWRKHLSTSDGAYVDSYAREVAHLGFVQGVKAAREQKP